MTSWLNWVDLVIVTIYLRALYGGFSRGALTELLALIGAVVTTMVTILFWAPIANWVAPWVWSPDDVVRFVTFWVLFLGCWVGVRQLRALAGQLLKWESFHWFLQGLGLCLGGLRGFWWAGFLLFVLVSSALPFFQEAVTTRSVLGPRILRIFRPSLDQVADRIPGAALRGGALVPPVPLALGGE